MEHTAEAWAWPWWSTMVFINTITFLLGIYFYKQSKKLALSSYTKKCELWV